MKVLQPCIKNNILELIERARKTLLYVSPGLDEQIADALVSASHRLKKDHLWVILDLSPQVIRIGYGRIEAIKQLFAAKINIISKRNLRIGFIRSDGLAFSFTPISALLEQENNLIDVINAISLNPEEADRITKALIPEVAQAFSSEKKSIEYEAAEIKQTLLSESEIKSAEEDLKKNPPVIPDLARKLRVLNSRFQFVEISFKGSKLGQRRINLSAADLGFDPEVVKNNLSGVWKVMSADIDSATEDLEQSLRCIRKKYFIFLPKFGNIILREKRSAFDEEMEQLKIRVEELRKDIRAKVEDQLRDGKERLKKLLANSLKKNPPYFIREMNFEPELQEKQIENQAKDIIDKRYPTVDDILSEMKLDWKIFNISEQIMEKEGFREAVRKAFSLDLEDLVKTEEAISLKSVGKDNSFIDNTEA